MGAQRPQFDSHRFVKRLTLAGLSEEVAEILADEHTNLIVPQDVATQGDVATVKTDVAAVKANVAVVKANVAAVKANVAAVETRVAAVETHVAAVDSKVDALATDLDTVKSRMATKEELHREIAASEQRLRNAILEAKVSLIKWMITSMMVFSGIVIAAMTALR